MSFARNISILRINIDYCLNERSKRPIERN